MRKLTDYMLIAIVQSDDNYLRTKKGQLKVHLLSSQISHRNQIRMGLLWMDIPTVALLP